MLPNVRFESGSVGWCSRAGACPHSGRAVGRTGAGRSRRGRHQGGALEDRRRHARLGTSVHRGQGRQSRRGLFPRDQSRQALDRMRLRKRGRQAHRAQARREVGHPHRELQGRRPEEIRARLREPRAVLPAPDLLLGDGLRAERPERGARRLRPDGARHRRLHGAHRHGGRRADARGRAGVGHLHRRLFGDRHSGGAAAARAHRQGRLRRYRARQLNRRRARQSGNELSRVGRGAEAHRQCASQHRAVSGVSGRGRAHHHRDRQ